MLRGPCGAAAPSGTRGVHHDPRRLRRGPAGRRHRRAYDSRVRALLAWRDASGLDGNPLTDSHDRDLAVRDLAVRDFAVRDYKTQMKTVLHRASDSVDAHLTALDHFFTELGLGPAVVRRDDAPELAARALDAPPASRSGVCAPSNAVPCSAHRTGHLQVVGQLT
ncbi:hypothetical protein EDD29_3966 [Actinocorallia herbida]|uniref:Uncharacterized protein n=1 Tax=Actinocorallia herbida TaxID=58109 RepID=A0A3N1CYQ4_9ACTN|nr:hypothetical protein [Actinocorallia herbida]ROO86400.1 hypothetical protein EDD29_3966 [Actinocorallia herbida]